MTAPSPEGLNMTSLTDEQIGDVIEHVIGHRDLKSGDKSLRAELAALLSASKPAATTDEFATAVRRMRKDETRGDTVFRCGFNGAIDAVLMLLADFPAAPAQSEGLIYQTATHIRNGTVWADVTKEMYDAHFKFERRIVYAAPPSQHAEGGEGETS